MDWMTSKDRACLGQAALFQASILDYSPTSDDYADLTEAEHAALAAQKAATEEKAIDVCYGCPFMMQCESWSVENSVSGVAGGRTEAERIEMRAERGLDQQPAQAEPSVCAADRGKRGKIDDATVARLTGAQWSSQRIADEMGCSVRTITRSRDRLAKAAAEQAAEQARVAAEQAAATALDDTLIRDEIADQVTQQSAARGAQYVAYTSGRPVTNLTCATTGAARPPRAGRLSPSMKAIYDALSDGQWHHRRDLINTGALFVTDEEALAWWDKNIAPKAKTAVADIPRAKRIADGARDKVANALSASARNGKHTTRGGPTGTDRALYRLASAAPAELVTT